MSSNLVRDFKIELANFKQKNVIVTTKDGKVFSGILMGLKDEDLTLVLGDVDYNGEKQHRLILSGDMVYTVILGEVPFDIHGLREELEKVFKKDGVRFYPETRTLMILDRYKVSEKGVEGAEGAVLDRIKRIWSSFNKPKED